MIMAYESITLLHEISGTQASGKCLFCMQINVSKGIQTNRTMDTWVSKFLRTDKIAFELKIFG